MSLVKQMLMHLLQLLEDSLQMHRLRYVIDGREGDSRDEHVQGMLGEWCKQQTFVLKISAYWRLAQHVIEMWLQLVECL